ncbi:type II secretion system F family protein, partial [Candidatus Poribacteria bacterium]|nr:type II secretion system F family protein [Candidatus Poribacteria bacterium]
RRINPEEARGRTSLFGREEPKPQPNKLQGRPSQVHFGDPIKPQAVEFFTFQLSTLVNSGVPLDRALTVCSEQMENVDLRRVVEKIRHDVERGESLAEALAKHPKQFDTLYTNMVDSGQQGGVLGLVLQRLSDFSRQQRELRDSVVSALIYPIILLGITVTIVAVLMFVVIPRFVSMFQDLGADLPAVTRGLIAVVNFASAPYGIFWMWRAFDVPLLHGVPLPGALLAVVLVVVGAVRRYKRTDEGMLAFDRARMRLPLMGSVVRNFALVRLTQTMSTLLDNGVMLLPALRVAKGTTGSLVYERALDEVEGQVERGAGLAGPLGDTGLFPLIVTDMLAIGEETGKPEVMLAHLAGYYDLEIKRSLERLVAALGPVLILFMAGIVVVIAVAIIYPIVNISQSLG